jgi:hypothetical protein
VTVGRYALLDVAVGYHEVQLANAGLRVCVERAREAGWSWEDIGAALDMDGKRARSLYGIKRATVMVG